MNYREGCKGDRLSLLGYGCMRFTKKGGGIDIDKAEKEVKAAIDAGVNYFDTAYFYKGNEAALGEILERIGCRDKIFIATKLPQYLVKSSSDFDKYFNEELKRLKTDRIDYYLMHMLTDKASWDKLLGLGIHEWITKKKASGQIRHIGFSFHGSTAAFLKILEAYDWDFCQIQYNYMDEHSQGGKEGLLAAHQKGMPVIIMEPLRGGKLVNMLPQDAKDAIKAYRVRRSAAEWAFLWLYDQAEVSCVLSGMTSLEMVYENIRIADEAKAAMLTAEDFVLIEKIRAALHASIKVGCTGCAYCMPCPHGVDIPGVFRCYNLKYTENAMSAFKEYFMATAARRETSEASKCIGCGLCEKHCPQNIPIREELKNAVGAFENPLYTLGRFVYKTVIMR